MHAQLARIESKVDGMSEAQVLNQQALDELLAVARQQGSGEITLFFPWNGDKPADQEVHGRLIEDSLTKA